MRIGIVCYPTFGGSGVMATELGLALADHGHEVHFITYSQPVRLNIFQPNVYYHEVRIPSYPLFEFPPYESALAGTMVDVVMNNDIDLLHCHYAIPHASAAYFAQQMLASMGKDIPFITTLHGTDITLVGTDIHYKPVVKFSIENSNAVTAVSENLKSQTISSFKTDKPIDVIYNFVDHKRFFPRHQEGLREIFAPHGESIIIHVSNFRKVKRVGDVLAVFRMINKEIPAKLLMIGDGPERAIMEDNARSMGICSDIRWLGKQDKLEDIYNIADLFLLPSQTESFGLAALEAMACGVPLISSDTGGLPEINIQGHTGYLSSVGAIKEMADGALRILKSPTLHQEMKDNVVIHSRQFSIENIIPKYEAIYNLVLEKAKV